MSRPRRLYFKRTHEAAYNFLGVCITGACFLLALMGIDITSPPGGGPGLIPPSLPAREEMIGWLLLWMSPVALVVLGLGVLGIHRGVFVDSEPRLLTVYWGWSLLWGKEAWPWWRVETRSPAMGATLELRALNPKKRWYSSLLLREEDTPLVLFSQLHHPDTRDKAESIARLLQLKLRDSTQRARDV